MMRFITEREVDLRQPRNKRKNHSQLNLKVDEESQRPDELESLSHAMSNLKKSDEEGEHLLKRLNVLREQEKKMQGRAIQNNSKLENYKTIRQEIQLHRKQSQQYRVELAKEMQITRSILAHQRQTQAYNLEQAKRKMYFHRWQNYLHQREDYRTQMNATKLHFQTQLLKKREKSLEIRQKEELQKQSIIQFHQQRRNKIKLDCLQERARLNSMAESKQEETSNLSHIESLLLSRQAKSRMNSEESTIMLQSIIANKNGANNCKHSNKSIHINDIYVI